MRFAAALLLIPMLVPAQGDQSAFRLSREDYPVVSGSTSTQPMGVLIAGRVTETSVVWQQSGFGGETRLAFTETPYDRSRKLVLDGKPPVATPSDLRPALPEIATLAINGQSVVAESGYVPLGR